jgi:putative MATE family efflux protein
MENTGLKKFIGDRAFYRRAAAVALPIMLQNVVTNFVSLLDNIMVGQTGTASMSGVAVVGQLFFIFYLLIFGTVSGPGIFCAQYWGAGDKASFKTAFRYKLNSAVAVCLVCMAIYSGFGPKLIGLYLTGEAQETAAVLDYGWRYLQIMLWGMLPYTVALSYSSTLREAGRTVVPMVSSWIAVALNLVLNWILIFGKLGAPAMGVEGAAIATVASRLAEMGINVAWSFHCRQVVQFTDPAVKAAPLRGALLGQLAAKSIPLMLNEGLWCLGSAALNQIYSTRGILVMAALNISYVLFDLFTAVAFSVGTSIGILVGQELGAGDGEKAVDTDRKLLTMGIMISVAICLVMLGLSELFPQFYNTSDEVKHLAGQLIRVMAAVLPLDCFAHGCYFTMRSGGKTLVTFLFDSCFSWVVNVPVAFTLAHYTGLGIVAVYTLSVFTVIIKCVIGGILVRKRYWVNTLTAQ